MTEKDLDDNLNYKQKQRFLDFKTYSIIYYNDTYNITIKERLKGLKEYEEIILNIAHIRHLLDEFEWRIPHGYFALANLNGVSTLQKIHDKFCLLTEHISNHIKKKKIILELDEYTEKLILTFNEQTKHLDIDWSDDLLRLKDLILKGFRFGIEEENNE